MQTFKFSTTKSEFISELRGDVKRYFEENKITQYGNSTIIVKTIVVGLFYIVPFALLVSGLISSVPLVIFFWIIMGAGMSGLGMVTMHDANHNSYSQSTRLNWWIGKSLYLLGGFPPNWRFQHNTLHHGYTNIEGQDEDIAPNGILRFSPHQSLRKIHRYQHIYAWVLYGLMTLSWIVAKDFKRFFHYKSMGAPLGKNGYKRLFIDLIVSKIIYYIVFLVIPILTIPVAWYWIVVGFIAMHATGGIILSTIFQTAHVVPTSEYPLPDEEGKLDNNWAVHQLHTTADFAPDSKLFSWFIGGLNYQIEHHLFPNISHIHYKAISKLVQKAAVKHDIPYHVNKTFFSALVKHGSMLKYLGHQQSLKIA